jgi:sulfur carrier protein
MNVLINGAACQLPPGATLAQAVRQVTAATSGIAAAVNDEVVSRAAWEATEVAEGDRVEVLSAVQGG